MAVGIQVNLGNRVPTFFGKELPTLLAVCTFCGCFIVIVGLYLLVLGAWCGSDCITSWILLFILVQFQLRDCHIDNQCERCRLVWLDTFIYSFKFGKQICHLLGKGLITLLANFSFLWLFNCICLSYRLKLRTWCTRSYCISSWVHWFTLVDRSPFIHSFTATGNNNKLLQTT